MKKCLLLLWFFVPCTTFISAQSIVDTLGSTIVNIDIVVDTNQFDNTNYATAPWDLYWGPDDQLWFTNRKKLEKYDPVSHNITTMLSLDRGFIMGVATHPSFMDTPWVYLTVDTAIYYAIGHRIELYRYEYDPISQVLQNPQLILHWDHPGEHSGGRLTFGPDGKLYVATSEYSATLDSIGNNSGKVLRVNPDGSAPADNFRPDYTWTYGHRNPQGITMVPNGNIVVAEFGMVWDEINLIEKGNHYGWFIFDGFQCIQSIDTCTFYMPQITFPIDTGINPHSGITYYDSPAIPELRGLITAVTGTNRGIMVYDMSPSYDAILSQAYYLTQEYGRVRDVCASPDGKLYFIAYDRVNPDIRVIYNPMFISAGSATVGSFRLFPNPATDQIEISRSVVTPRRWEIHSVTGAICASGELSGRNARIDISALPPGFYLFSLADEPGGARQKFVISGR